jgi:hypothetical protein
MLTLEQVLTARKNRQVLFSTHATERLREHGISEQDVFWGLEHANFQKNKIEEEKGTRAEMLVVGWEREGRSFASVFSRKPKALVVNVVTAYEHNHNYYRELKERKDFTMADNLPAAMAAQEDPQQTKKCIKCGKVRPLEEFTKNSSSPDGLHYYCRVCAAEAARAYNARKKEREGNVKETTMKGQGMVTVNDPDFKSYVASLLKAEGYDILNERPTSFVVEFEKQLSLKPKRKEETA